MLVLGAAYQAGAIPVSAAAIEEAIKLNAVSVTMNTQAFRAGRLLVADPAWLSTLKRHRLGAAVDAPQAPLTPAARALVDRVGADGELRRLLEIRVPELIAYQNEGYAAGYVDFVKRVRAAEQAAVPGATELSEAVARYLFKLMAYKDEYEVARLHLQADLAHTLAEEFPAACGCTTTCIRRCSAPSASRARSSLGSWFDGAFRMLAGMKGVRGTALDPFGRATVRRVEQALPGEYRALIERALGGLSSSTYERAVTLARLPDLIRGYEDIKLANVEKFRAEVRALGV
jgi:indolepyruvate ferredoxin oxidoreductase